MTGSDGRKYACMLPTTAESNLTSATEHPEPTPLPSHAVLIKTLKDRCFRLRKGYWDYEVCPGQSVKQFHMEGQQRGASFDLGLYDETLDEDYEEHYVQHFVSGSGGRRASVTFQCNHAEPEHHKVVSVEEPQAMSYVIDFSSSLMCLPRTDKASRSPAHLLDRLRSTCIPRNEGWWQYELCYMRHVVQYHQEGDVRTIEIVLGRFDFDLNRQLELDGKSIVHANPTYFLQHYVNGTSCEPLLRENRTAEVRFECNPGRPVNYIRSVEESPTCHYIVHVVTPFVCTHHAFLTPDDDLQHINCVPIQT
eukprot:CAMPEP_0196661394 /NCGR_PEP_ID=MMETSP1086-20130531/44010_1 /TAXON_ID=77921 /ORGANISM="Cyanoptyche  gloeocystis , Strain SAG4.97" /LENGTH=306 /DNA_ID=CAMNT_0041996257 /DNA_START=195 /DNA_END=1115 /DNA_ORIENTATION=-